MVSDFETFEIETEENRRESALVCLRQQHTNGKSTVFTWNMSSLRRLSHLCVNKSDFISAASSGADVTWDKYTKKVIVITQRHERSCCSQLFLIYSHPGFFHGIAASVITPHKWERGIFLSWYSLHASPARILTTLCIWMWNKNFPPHEFAEPENQPKVSSEVKLCYCVLLCVTSSPKGSLLFIYFNV